MSKTHTKGQTVQQIHMNLVDSEHLVPEHVEVLRPRSVCTIVQERFNSISEINESLHKLDHFARRKCCL
jgi:hypothetical protein